jgi:hypothetical protein
MLKERPSLVSAVHALFPTFSHMAQTPNGRSLSPLFSSWSLRPVFYSTSFLSYLPTGLTSRLVSLVTGQSGSGANITTELVSSPETVIAALVMARQELAKVTALDVDLLDQYGDRLWIYWTEKGGWMGHGRSDPGDRGVLGEEVGRGGQETPRKVSRGDASRVRARRRSVPVAVPVHTSAPRCFGTTLLVSVIAGR